MDNTKIEQLKDMCNIIRQDCDAVRANPHSLSLTLKVINSIRNTVTDMREILDGPIDPSLGE